MFINLTCMTEEPFGSISSNFLCLSFDLIHQQRCVCHTAKLLEQGRPFCTSYCSPSSWFCIQVAGPCCSQVTRPCCSQVPRPCCSQATRLCKVITNFQLTNGTPLRKRWMKSAHLTTTFPLCHSKTHAPTLQSLLLRLLICKCLISLHKSVPWLTGHVFWEARPGIQQDTFCLQVGRTSPSRPFILSRLHPWTLIHLRLHWLGGLQNLWGLNRLQKNRRNILSNVLRH